MCSFPRHQFKIGIGAEILILIYPNMKFILKFKIFYNKNVTITQICVKCLRKFKRIVSAP